MIIPDESHRHVYHTQQVFRALTQAMSEPGRITLIPPLTALDLQAGLSPYLASIALTLLDGQVNFAVAGAEKEVVAEGLRILSFANRARKWRDAEYIFVQKPVDRNEIEAMMTDVSCGTLEEPQQGTFFSVQVHHIYEGTGEKEPARSGTRLRLGGPGILGSRVLIIEELDEEWLIHRNRLVRNYPMGIDMMLIDEMGLTIGLPRSITINHEEM